jgi:hypothetical protein
MRNLESHLAKLECLRPVEPLIIRLGRRGEVLAPEEIAALETEERRRIKAGEGMILTLWDRAHAQRLGASASATEKPAAGGLGIRITCDGRLPIDL